MGDASFSLPAHVATRLAPGMLDAMLEERRLEAAIPGDESIATKRLRGKATAGHWIAGMPEPVAIEDHVVTGPRGTVPVRLFRGRIGAPAPVLLYVHGGGWVAGSVAQNEPAIRMLVDRSGWTVAAPTYRLAPEDPYPAGLDDCIAVTAWLAAEAGPLGVDARRLVLGGASAGANVAMAAALAMRPIGLAAGLAGLLLFYGVFGSDLDTESYRAFGAGDFGLSRASMAQYLEHYDPERRRSHDPLIAPLLGDLAGLPPALLVAAELDVLMSDSLAMQARLEAAGVASRLRLEKGVTHGFINRGRMVPGAMAALEDAAAFLAGIGGRP